MTAPTLSLAADGRLLVRFRVDARALDHVRSIPGREWSQPLRGWLLPPTKESVRALLAWFGPGFECDAIPADHPLRRLITPLLPSRPAGREIGAGVVPRDAAAGAPPLGDSPDDLLARLERELTVRAYSPRTRKAYLAHVRHFLAARYPPPPRTTRL